MTDKELPAIPTLAELGAEEFWQREGRKVLEDIDDPSTPAAAKRSVTLMLTFRPDTNRDSCQIIATVPKTTVPGPQPYSTRVGIYRDGGKLEARIGNPDQAWIDMSPEDPS